MSKNLSLKTLLVITACICFLIIPLSGKSLIVFFNYASFKSSDSTAFTELYFKIPVSACKLVKNDEGKYQASLLVTYVIKQKNNILSTNSYYLESPGLNDTLNLDFALLDLKRISFRQGVYNLEIKVADVNDTLSRTSFELLLNNRFPLSSLYFSDVELADTIYPALTQGVFTRNNFNIHPTVFNSYSIGTENLYFYFELYNSLDYFKDQNFFIQYSVAVDSVKIADHESLIKVTPGMIIPVNGSLNIRKLDAGDYNLIIEVINAKNKLILKKVTGFSIQKKEEMLLANLGLDSKSLFISLVKSYSDPQLKLCMDYIYNLSDKDETAEGQKIEADSNSEKTKVWVIKIWLKKYPENPAQEWVKYLTRIEQCNKMFSTLLRKGYLTDRGRVYLEYGPPNNIIESPEPGISYPYQIWHYYTLTNSQFNKKFIFFNSTGALNEYTLLHSDARGETQNENWQNIIRKYNNNVKFGDHIFGDFLESDFKK